MGGRNYKAFRVMIAFGFLFFLTKMALTLTGMILYYPGKEHLEENFERVYHVFSPIALLITSIPQMLFDLVCALVLGELNALHVFLGFRKMTTYELIMERRKKKNEKIRKYEEQQASNFMGATTIIQNPIDTTPSQKSTKGLMVETNNESDEHKTSQNTFQTFNTLEAKQSHEEMVNSPKKKSSLFIISESAPMNQEFQKEDESLKGKQMESPSPSRIKESQKKFSFNGKKFDDDSVEEVDEEDFKEPKKKENEEKIETGDVECGIESEKFPDNRGTILTGNSKNDQSLLRRSSENEPLKEAIEIWNQERKGEEERGKEKEHLHKGKTSQTNKREKGEIPGERQTAHQNEKEKRVNEDTSERDSVRWSKHGTKSPKKSFKERLNGFFGEIVDRSINFVKPFISKGFHWNSGWCEFWMEYLSQCRE